MGVFDYLRETLGVSDLEGRLEETEKRAGEAEKRLRRIEGLLDNPQLMEFIEALAASAR